MQWVTCEQCGRRVLDVHAPKPTRCGKQFCNIRCERQHRLDAEDGCMPALSRGRNSTTAQAREFARALGRMVGGQVVTGSGSVFGLDGDRVTRLTMIEEKTARTKFGYRLLQTTLQKLETEAARRGFYSALVVEVPPYVLAVVPEHELMSRRRKNLELVPNDWVLVNHRIRLDWMWWEHLVGRSRSDLPSVRLSFRLHPGEVKEDIDVEAIGTYRVLELTDLLTAFGGSL